MGELGLAVRGKWDQLCKVPSDDDEDDNNDIDEDGDDDCDDDTDNHVGDEDDAL